MEGSSKQFVFSTETNTASDEVKTTKLQDLNVDCLEKLFWYLDIDDLVNIVVFDSRFTATAEQVFRRKFCQSEQPTTVSNIQNNVYNLDKLNHSVQLLNIFGKLLTNVCVNFKLENVGCLLDAIKQNCRQKVTKLEFHHARQTRQKSYIHERGTQSINNFLKRLNHQLPCLRQLSLVFESNLDDCPYWYDTNEIVIPSMTHFSINGRFTYDSFRRFVHVNPQIESLAVTVKYQSFEARYSEEEFIQLLDSALPQLKYLKMCVPYYLRLTGRNHTVDALVYFRNLKKFASTGESSWKPNFLHFAGDQLEELELHHFICSSNSFLNSILHFKKLKRIVIEDSRYCDEDMRLKFENDINVTLANDELIKVIIRDKPIRNTIETAYSSLRGNLNRALEQLRAVTNRPVRL